MFVMVLIICGAFETGPQCMVETIPNMKSERECKRATRPITNMIAQNLTAQGFPLLTITTGCTAQKIDT